MLTKKTQMPMKKQIHLRIALPAANRGKMLKVRDVKQIQIQALFNPYH
jgi:hypothetical protein